MQNRFRSAILMVILVICMPAFFSCAVRNAGSIQHETAKIYPSPPDTARIQYLTSISSSTDIQGQQKRFNRFLFGDAEPINIIKPYGITSSGSKLYICDTGIGGIVIFDLAGGSFSQFTPSGKGQLQFPVNCAVDSDGKLYIADANRQQVVVFDNEGNYLDAFGETSEGFKPTGIAISGNSVMVSSISDHRVYIYDKLDHTVDTRYIGGEPGNRDYLYQPANIAYHNGNIFVSDIGDYRIKVFGEDGSYLRSVGSYGSNFGQFMRPKGVAVDNELNTYVVDAAFENVQIFNSKGQLLMYFGGPYKSPGDMWLPADISVDYENLDHFRKYVDPEYNLEYLIYVTNQYGPGKIGVYGFISTKK